MTRGWMGLAMLFCLTWTWLSVAEALHVSLFGQLTGALSIGFLFGKLWK